MKVAKVLLAQGKPTFPKGTGLLDIPMLINNSPTASSMVLSAGF
nr:hypothetical protein [Nostoc sp. EkiNYC01]